MRSQKNMYKLVCTM